MATPESWSLLQSAYAERDQVAASRSSILPLMRFIQCAPPPRKPNCVHSRHASVSSVVSRQADESCSALVVSHHLDGLLRKWAPGVLQPVTAVGFDAFQTSVPASPGPKTHQGGDRKSSSQRGSHPSKNPPRQQPRRITAVVTLLMFDHPVACSKSGDCASDPRGRDTHGGAEARECSRSHARRSASTPTGSPLFAEPPHTSEDGVCKCAEAHTGRKCDHSTSTVYETPRKTSRCRSIAARQPTEVDVRGPPLLGRPKSTLTRHECLTEQHATPSQRLRRVDVPTEVEHNNAGTVCGPKTATRKHLTG
jgi:hypothetical protein